MSAPADCQLIGRLRIVEADLSDRGYLELCGPATITIGADNNGEIAFSTLQTGLAIRTILFASAAAASFGGLHSSRPTSQREAAPRPRRTCRITAVAPATSMRRKASSPARVITPSLTLPAG